MIKSRINFYTDEFHPKADWFSLRQLIVFIILLSVVVSVVIAGLTWYESQRREELIQVTTQLEQSQAALKSAQVKLAQRKVDSKLKADIEQKQQDLKLKQSLLRRLDKQQYSNAGFSAVLKALAAIPDPQVWLSEIQINEGRMALKGQAKSSDAVPHWVDQFKYYPALSHQSFSGLRIYRNDEDQLLFELNGKEGSDE